MAGLNNSVCSSGLGHRFITLAFAVLDPKAHTISVTNAGHLPPLLRTHKGPVQSLATKSSSLPLGINPDTTYSQTQVKISPGDTLILFTDGVTEAMNKTNVLYSATRLAEFAQTAPPQAEALGEAIVADVEKFCEGMPQRDDICLICIHRKA
jgi:sigma-B regulation protein RsbU (phosphoserine phosphatase)